MSIRVTPTRMPPAAALDRRITLHLPGPMRHTPLGQPVPTTTSVEIWAQVLPAGGREGAESDQVVARVEADFIVRWRADVAPRCQITHDGLDYDVVSVDEIGRRKGLRVRARARSERAS